VSSIWLEKKVEELAAKLERLEREVESLKAKAVPVKAEPTVKTLRLRPTALS